MCMHFAFVFTLIYNSNSGTDFFLEFCTYFFKMTNMVEDFAVDSCNMKALRKCSLHFYAR